MKRNPRVLSLAGLAMLMIAACLLAGCTGNATETTELAPMQLQLGDTEFHHRWSKAAQHEFTPVGDDDLQTWNDMLTINVHADVTEGEELAGIANTVLGNYEGLGKILHTNSRPRTGSQPAEHFIAAVLGNPDYLEAAFARFVLVDGTGIVVVRSHRIYGAAVGPAMSEWLAANGEQVEKSLMSWEGIPTPSALAHLPHQD